MSPTDESSAQDDREIFMARVIAAPRELVFRAFTDPDHLARWWGPDGFTTTTHRMDFRPGGEWRFIMHGPDGRDYENHVVYDEIDEPSRIVYRQVGGEAGVETVLFQSTVIFEPQEGATPRTRLTLRMVFPSTEERDRVEREHGAVQGGMQHLARLASYATQGLPTGNQHALTLVRPSETRIILQRVFDAPRDRVFEALSKPEHIRRWWGPRVMEMTVCEMDFRPGGKWRFVHRAPDGQEHPFKGEYLEIDAPHRIVQTFIYDVEGARDHVATETLTLEERGGQTILTVTTVADPGTCAQSDEMEAGAAESYDRLEELLQSMA